MINDLKVELMKKVLYKNENTFLNHLEILEEILMLKLIFQSMQQKLILKM